MVTSPHSISPTPGVPCGRWGRSSRRGQAKVTWADVNEARYWARTAGWSLTQAEQARAIHGWPAFAGLHGGSIISMLLNQTWCDLNYDLNRRGEPILGTIDAAMPSTPAFLAWVLMWLLLVRRLTGGLVLPPGLGGSTYYEAAQ